MIKTTSGAIRGRDIASGGRKQKLELRKDGCINTITTVQKDNVLIESNSMKNIRIRKLTPKECWRLMGFTDEDFEKARLAMNENCYGGKDRSQSQLYKQAGNSIVVNVLYYIMQNLKEAMPHLFEDMKVGSFFSGIGAFEKALSMLDETGTTVTYNNVDNPDLVQIGYINDYNGDANRIYGNVIARTLKAEAGGGGAKTGWYCIDETTL